MALLYNELRRRAAAYRRRERRHQMAKRSGQWLRGELDDAQLPTTQR